MWVLNQGGTTLVNTHTNNRFTITEQSDAVLIMFASHCIARYYTLAEAKENLVCLFNALLQEEECYEMPRSLKQDTFERKRDARTKRKGGS